MSTADEIMFVRKAREADLGDVLRFYAQPEIDDGVVLPMDEASAIFAQFSAYPHYKLYVVERGKKVIGSYAFLVMHNLGHLGAPSAIVEDVVVAPECQGQGVGRLMMQHAMQCARMAGCYKLVLSSNAKRERAHEFYEKIGFERHGYSFIVRLDREGTP